MMTSVERANLIAYPFQLRLGLWVFLYLPPQITRADVERICRMLEQLPTEIAP